MLDIKLLRDDRATVQDNVRTRGVQIFDDLPPSTPGWEIDSIDRLVALDDGYRTLLHEEEELRQRQNENTAAVKRVAALPKAEQAAAREPLVEEGRRLRELERELAAKTASAREDRDAAWGRVPNLTHPEVPPGGDRPFEQLRTWGTIRDFAAEGFEPRDHLALAEQLDLVDFEAGAKVAGQKFFYLKGDAVLLDLALQRYALDKALEHGFRIYTTPDLARASVVQALGFNPRGESTQVYSIASSDLCLVGTAEITLGGMLADTLWEEEQLPLLMAGLSHCFRTEAGAAGQESRGLYRVHQFTKVELFAVTVGELAASDAMHAKLLAIEEDIFRGLDIPFRVLDMGATDLGGPAYRKFDLEAWMPGRNEWGEITSTSNCTDYQARRLRVRYRPQATGKGKEKNRFVHLLNGTAIATSRALVALLENHQQADGSVVVPAPLRTWVGKSVIGP